MDVAGDEGARTGVGARRRRGLAALLILLLAACSSSGRHEGRPGSFYGYRFHALRDRVRHGAMGKPDRDIVLEQAQLALASLADGDSEEANTAFDDTYRWMESADLNTKGRTFSSIVTVEKVRVWKGEPFEQALTYYGYAVTKALRGEWDNARAVIRGSLRMLRDYAHLREEDDRAEVDSEKLAQLAAVEETKRAEAKGKGGLKGYEFFRDEVKLVETDFALGYLLQGLATRRLGREGPGLESAVKLDERFAPLAQAIHAGRYNTVLFVDYGRGPRKIRYGRDDVFTRWQPTEQRSGAELQVFHGGHRVDAFGGAILDLHAMSVDHRWNNFEQVRDAKSKIGRALLLAGTAYAVYADHRRDHDQVLVGLGVAILGGALRRSARADIRHIGILPHTSYLTVFELPDGGGPKDLEIRIADDASSTFVLPRVRPGTADRPLVLYLRLWRTEGSGPPFLRERRCHYRNDHEPPRRGDFPYILGGSCVARPSRAALSAYQAGGYCEGMTVADLEELYRKEGIRFHPGPGPERSLDWPYFGHVLTGGLVLLTPAYGSVGYKALMYAQHPPYQPRSETVRALAEEIAARRRAAPATAP